MPTPVIAIDALTKSYGGLRPLRIRQLVVSRGERVGLSGFDETTAELFVNLVTGATLPDQGRIDVFGRSTAEIPDSAEWLATVDRFGLVSSRIVLLDAYTAAQNVAMSLTLDIDPLPADVAAAVGTLGAEVGLGEEHLSQSLADASPATRHRVRLARAAASDPGVLVMEHPAAGVPAGDVAALAADVRRLADRRGLAVIVLAAQPDQVKPFVSRVLQLNAATGDLVESRGLLGRLFGK